MDYEKVINEMKYAWDALDVFPVKGYSDRARIQLAQEMILDVFNMAAQAKKAAEEAKKPEEDPAEE